MLAKREDETTNAITKRTYSYNDIVKMQNDSIYSGFGKIIPSHMPTAPRATFGTAEKKKQ